MNLNKIAKELHQQNLDMGWWNGEPCIYTKMQLISTEISEATEGERQDLMDDKLPHRKMGEVELADALMRALDLCKYLGIILRDTKQAYMPVIDSNWSISRKHLELNRYLIELTYRIEEFQNDETNFYWLSTNSERLVYGIITVANQQGYDIESALMEKMAFNKTRKDHQQETRTKKF